MHGVPNTRRRRWRRLPGPLGSFAAVLCSALLGPPALADPQDGPHADIRVTVTDKDVRFVIGMNLPFVDAAAPVAREAPDDLDPAEEPAVLAAIRAFIAEQCPVEIDGAVVRPRFERMAVERLDEDLMGLFPVTGRSALTRFSLVVVYPAPQTPETVRFRWGAFPESALGAALDRLEAGEARPRMTITGLLVAGGRVTRFLLSEPQPWHEWHRDGLSMADVMLPVPAPGLEEARRVPILSAGAMLGGLGFAGVGLARGRRWTAVAGVLVAVPVAVLTRDIGTLELAGDPIAEAEARAVFEPLHANVYRAFDYSGEDDIFDALALSVGGDLLHTLYTQISTGLIQAEHDGAMGRVTDVRLLDASIVDRATDGFRVDAEWEVEGTVYHFGHSHAKRRLFSGMFRVEPGDGRWLITAATPRSAVDLRPTEL